MQTPPHTMSTPNQSSRKPKRPHKKSLSLPARNGVTAPDDGGERTVRNLRLSKALTIPDGTTVSDACRRMAARRIDAVLLTDSNALLSGIITDKVTIQFHAILFALNVLFSCSRSCVSFSGRCHQSRRRGDETGGDNGVQGHDAESRLRDV